MKNKKYYIYMLRCENNSIYTGITTDIDRRMKEHFNKENKCAKYTFNNTAIKIEIIWETENRVLASKFEYHIKKLTKKDKEKLIEKPDILNDILGKKIESIKYILKTLPNYELPR